MKHNSATKLVAASLLVIGATLGLACKGGGEDEAPPQSEAQAASPTPAPTATPTPKPTRLSRVGEVLDFGDDLTATILADGDGAELPPGGTARLHLVLSDDIGNEKWSGEFTLRRGVGQGIAGLDRGLDKMKAGERRLIKVPWQLGYGEEGEPGSGVRPREDLHIEVTLLAIEPDTTKGTHQAP